MIEAVSRVAAELHVPMALSQQLAPSAGLRNRLIHAYDLVDDTILLQSVTTCRHQYPLYIQAIEDDLKRPA